MAHDLSYVHEFSFDGATKAAMNEFLHNYQNPDSTYRRQYRKRPTCFMLIFYMYVELNNLIIRH